MCKAQHTGGLACTGGSLCLMCIDEISLDYGGEREREDICIPIADKERGSGVSATQGRLRMIC